MLNSLELKIEAQVQTAIKRQSMTAAESMVGAGTSNITQSGEKSLVGSPRSKFLKRRLYTQQGNSRKPTNLSNLLNVQGSNFDTARFSSTQKSNEFELQSTARGSSVVPIEMKNLSDQIKL
jgi:hypothetical protein